MILEGLVVLPDVARPVKAFCEEFHHEPNWLRIDGNAAIEAKRQELIVSSAASVASSK
jgi:hypothetical protein